MSDEPVEDDRPPAGNGSDESVAIEAVLVPVDGSDESMTAIEYALALAERYDARVHVLHVLDETLVREIANGTVPEREVAARGEAFVDNAREHAPETVSLTHSTAYGFSPTQKTRHPGSVILDSAEDTAIDFIVIPRERAEGGSDTTLSRAAEYVLQYADQPVLSV